jgi:hypothetical protein
VAVRNLEQGGGAFAQVGTPIMIPGLFQFVPLRSGQRQGAAAGHQPLLYGNNRVNPWHPGITESSCQCSSTDFRECGVQPGN